MPRLKSPDTEVIYGDSVCDKKKKLWCALDISNMHEVGFTRLTGF